MERVKDSHSIGKGIAWSVGGGVGSGAQGAHGMASPSIDATAEIPGQWIAQLAASGAGGNGGGSEGDPVGDAAVGCGGGRQDDKGREFTLVNPRNITIPTFTGKAFNTKPYLLFNNAIGRLTMAQGAGGDTLLTILNKVKKQGPNTFTNDMLQELITIYPKAPEFDRAIRAALYNWTNGIAKGLVQHNVANGLDAWRKLYHKYIRLASDLQDILIRELYDLKPAFEADINNLFDEVARIRDLYLKAGLGDDLSDRWIKSVILRNLPKDLVKNLAFELRKADTIEDIQSLITIYLHDPVTGLARGQPGPLICLTTQDQAEEEDKTGPKTYSQAASQPTPVVEQLGAAQLEPSQEANLNAVKGDRKGKAKGKGYGE